ncbi:chromosomal replication initiator protein DnaA [Ruficoccus amylovorans]|uniref:Chromosomal replication initiator protein DnaA n=1 Tax=Ruficoccus amylovorans TaxID=1804625 RepID=A0A842HK72_9BACT|nr:chromosomal replication initiator protein DnaA [Ruficoccus amylovorans]MBC2596348.1 chromosomal replication initiator protein DnaA [Ruficoccus amylovorans]
MSQQSHQTTLWDTIKGDLQSLFPHDVYRTWFEPVQCVDESDDFVTLEVPNDFSAFWIQDNYQDIITKRLCENTGHAMGIRYRVSEGEAEADTSKDDGSLPGRAVGPVAQPRTPRVNEPRERTARKGGFSSRIILNPRNTFENFVVGAGNQLAHAACMAVANAPARAYNPLFLYGDTGLGKTHLMHSVAQHALRTNPDAEIAYISTESFTNEFIEAIQTNTVTKFRQRYRQVDMLLIDDIHFLSGKERIQEEFFHTFNELFERQKQIFLSSDRPASEIAKLESRLVSRFQWGLVADIQPPDFETRVAILGKKAKSMNLELPEPILQFLAERVSRNVRRMEGALTRVAGFAALMKSSIDIPTVERLLHDILQEEAQNKVTIEKIQQKVADYYKLRLTDMVSKRRPANIAFPRQIAMYLSRMLTSHSLQEIGDAFGGRDHGTVIHACKTVENIMEQDDSVSRAVDYLQKQLAAHRF